MARGLFCAAAMLACAACGAVAVESRPMDGVQAMAADAGPHPRWVQQQGCESGLWQARRVICAVGSAHGYKDPSLAVSAAQAHGRAELAKAVSTRVASHFKEASIHTTSLVDGQPVEQKDAKGDIDEVVDRSISGVRSEQVSASKSGTVYALMMLVGLALLDQQDGAFEQARERLQKALSLYQTVGDLHRQARVHQLWSNLCRNGGDSKCANAHAQVAATMYRELHVDPNGRQR